MKMVRFALLALSASVGFSAFATEPSEDLFLVTRALVNNPEIVRQLKENNTPAMQSYEIRRDVGPERDMNTYEMTFVRDCHCVPSTATVKIVEDRTPTHSDGAPEYSASIDIRDGGIVGR